MSAKKTYRYDLQPGDQITVQPVGKAARYGTDGPRQGTVVRRGRTNIDVEFPPGKPPHGDYTVTVTFSMEHGREIGDHAGYVLRSEADIQRDLDFAALKSVGLIPELGMGRSIPDNVLHAAAEAVRSTAWVQS